VLCSRLGKTVHLRISSSTILPHDSLTAFVRRAVLTRNCPRRLQPPNRIDRRLLRLLSILLFPPHSKKTYRLYFHPLAEFPAPREAAISNQWLFTQHKGGYPEPILEALHKEHNTNALRIGPNELHITDPLVSKQIYSQIHPFPKDIDFYSMFQTPRTLFVETVPALHKECRRALNPLFSRQGVLKLEPMLTESAEELTGKILRLAKREPLNGVGAFKSAAAPFLNSSKETRTNWHRCLDA
jgi:hypothetical protein